jgi:hypothetical protein
MYILEKQASAKLWRRECECQGEVRAAEIERENGFCKKRSVE